MTHELRYRAGSLGLGKLGIRDAVPHWYCSCGEWRRDRDQMGRPFEDAAKRLHRRHVEAAG